MPLQIDTRHLNNDLVDKIEITIGNETIVHSFGRKVSMSTARTWALHYVDVCTGRESTLVVNGSPDPVVEETPDTIVDEPQEKAARALLATLYPDYTKRWNVEVTQDGIIFCNGHHEKGERCEHDPISIRKKSADVYKHKKRGSLYHDLGDGILQVEDGVILKDGDALKAYIDEENLLWFRTPEEFHDGRFEEINDTELVKTIPSLLDNNKPLTTFSGTLGIPVSRQSEELKRLLEWARKWHETASDEEKEAMWAAQRKSWASGQYGPTDGMGTKAVRQ